MEAPILSDDDGGGDESGEEWESSVTEKWRWLIVTSK